MWICMTTGFVSVTKRKAHTIEAGDDRTMQVRAREASHLAELRRLMAESGGAILSETIKSKGTDYQYRAFCTQRDLAVGMAALAYAIDYVNFKDTVTDVPLHNVYMRIWSAVLDTFPVGSIYGWSQPQRRRGGKGGKRGGGRGAGGATEAPLLERPWWSDGPSVDEELAMRDRGDANPFDRLPPAWERA